MSPVASPAARVAGGATYTSSSPGTVPASSSGLWRSWAYALRATIRHRSASRGYGRTLSTRSASPSQMRPPPRRTSRASDTSSITACRIDSGMRARSAASVRSSTQPPAAAAVRDSIRFTRRNG